MWVCWSAETLNSINSNGIVLSVIVALCAPKKRLCSAVNWSAKFCVSWLKCSTDLASEIKSIPNKVSSTLGRAMNALGISRSINFSLMSGLDRKSLMVPSDTFMNISQSVNFALFINRLFHLFFFVLFMESGYHPSFRTTSYRCKS